MTATVNTALSPFLDARQGLATAIQAATGYTCHPSHEAAIATPCYVLEGDGWVSLAADNVVAYKIKVTCLYANQSGDLADGVEELARLAYVACADYGCRGVEVEAPGAVAVGANDYAGVQFTTTLAVTFREI